MGACGCSTTPCSSRPCYGCEAGLGTPSEAFLSKKNRKKNIQLSIKLLWCFALWFSPAWPTTSMSWLGSILPSSMSGRPRCSETHGCLFGTASSAWPSSICVFRFDAMWTVELLAGSSRRDKLLRWMSWSGRFRPSLERSVLPTRMRASSHATTAVDVGDHREQSDQQQAGGLARITGVDALVKSSDLESTLAVAVAASPCYSRSTMVAKIYSPRIWRASWLGQSWHSSPHDQQGNQWIVPQCLATSAWMGS